MYEASGGAPKAVPGRARKSLLSTREKEVAARLVQGMSFKEISDDLDLNVETVRSHAKKIYRKCEVHSRGALVWKIIGSGMGFLGDFRSPMPPVGD